MVVMEEEQGKELGEVMGGGAGGGGRDSTVGRARGILGTVYSSLSPPKVLSEHHGAYLLNKEQKKVGVAEGGVWG